ncbi:ribonuclease P protein component [Neorickettsia sennetsu]|uniref:Ribonuclease P protein component n=1 Tax=Ehrlichia sennetsu (strain ATCC VR-367 / Miyayama) TaxID=222891 RepID=Q2GCS2_EHRS3|nr:ribonuclease P protein component [Neorickettsia sennetsu]ABD45712.1 ribonuclease P protein component [Neorickettsia sennetsu str. Miyayama]
MRLRGVKILSGRTFRYYQCNSFGCRSGSILLLISRGTTVEPVVGFIVTKKVGSAVKRNKVRRKLRGLLPFLVSMKKLLNRAYIFIPSPASVFSDFSAMREDVLSCLERAGRSH